MAQLIRKEDALEYHRKGRPGKIEVTPTKETKTRRDLALAYSPGVAEPCLEIAKNPEDVYQYTAKGNLSSDSSEAITVRNAVATLRQRYPDMIVDGEMQAGVAFNSDLLRENYPFSALVNEPPNVLIFPNLASGNIAYHLLQEVGGAEAIGPILLDLRKPVHVLQLGSSVRQIVNMIAIAVGDAQMKATGKSAELPFTTT